MGSAGSKADKPAAPLLALIAILRQLSAQWRGSGENSSCEDEELSGASDKGELGGLPAAFRRPYRAPSAWFHSKAAGKAAPERLFRTRSRPPAMWRLPPERSASHALD